MNYFTSITLNYLPKARILAKSIKQYNKDAKFFLVISDVLPENFEISEEPFDKVYHIEDLELPVDNLQAWIFKHSVVELCTAVKGQAFLTLINREKLDKLIYLDPDIAVYSDMSELDELMEAHSIILTPHQTIPEETDDAIIDNELCSLKHGVYNLGFLAIKADEEGMRFVTWWRDRLLNYCYDAIPDGIFTDQKWVDIAPCMFDVFILRDKTYNVSTWNLSHRSLARNGEGIIEVEGKPLNFYHFSGFDSGAQLLMLKKYYNGNDLLLEMREWYIRRMDEEGQQELGSKPCVFGFYYNGEKITNEQRQVYRTRGDLMQYFKNPGGQEESGESYYNWFIDEQKRLAEEELQRNQAELLRTRQELEAITNSRLYRILVRLRAIKRVFIK